MTFYVTRGLKYHQSKSCPLMTGGEDLWDGDGEDYWHNAGSYRREVPTPQQAAAQGKWPCLSCVEKGRRVFPPLYTSFGHEPVDEYEGTEEAEHGATRIVCKRCTTWERWTDVNRIEVGTRVSWPCTSAVVLGIAERPVGCTCIHGPELDAGQCLHSSYCPRAV